MAVWEWIPESSGVQAEVELRHDAMDAMGNFGTVRKILRKKPIRNVTFGATFLVASETNAIFAQVQAGDLDYELTDYMGRTWSGTIETFQEKAMIGTRKFDAVLAMKDVTVS